MEYEHEPSHFQTFKLWNIAKAGLCRSVWIVGNSEVGQSL